MDTSSATLLACGAMFLLSFVMIWAFWFVERLRGASAPTCEAGQVERHVGGGSMRLTTRSEPFEIAIKKSRGFLRGFSRVRLLPVSSVGTDSDANAGGADADAAATFLIAAPLDITLARGISV